MPYKMFIDRFTSLDHLSGKDRKDPEAVLAVLREKKRFSVWDMDYPAIRTTVNGLERTGRIKLDRTAGYPWIGVTVVNP